MNPAHILLIASELAVKPGQVQATAELFEGGATVPFIARYRKEATGSLDEVAITAIRTRLTQLAELDARREAILASLQERNLLTDELKAQIIQAGTMTALEDIYLPYRPKRRTRATVAREKGLEPLAKLILAQDPATDPLAQAATYIDAGKGVESVEDALAGAKDIIAEWVNEDQTARTRIRELFHTDGIFRTKVIEGKETEGCKFEDYFNWEEPVAKAPSHRILAMRRGARDGFLRLQVAAPEEQATRTLEMLFVRSQTGSPVAQPPAAVEPKGSSPRAGTPQADVGQPPAADKERPPRAGVPHACRPSPCTELVRTAALDGYKRLLAPSMETEILMETKERADQEAIRVFAENLRELLLAPPLGRKNVLAIDPGFRTGCKVVCLDRQGQLKYTDVVYLHQADKPGAMDGPKIAALCQKFEIGAIAIGNGTASRETEDFIRGLQLPSAIAVVVVNESGASVYSASEVAREEFPDYDVTVRGAVSIGRRLMDPLAELVKIDPKSIGVGQYQHDVDQGMLKQSLDDVVISCVNSVGVEVNTASKQLLQYVSGLGPQLAQNIISYRNEKGPFRSREDLKEVPRLGAKAFEQAAGFLRIQDAAHPLDASAVHPESYHVVDTMATNVGCSVVELMKDSSLRQKIRLEDYVTATVGLPTLNDILQELAKPGRDPRQQFEVFSFAEGVRKMEDLKEGMRLPGIVTNVTAFGAFVDIGVHQDGLVHISQLADRFVKDPAQVVKVHQKVMATVLAVDLVKKRISLSLKDPSKPAPAPKAKDAPKTKDAPKATPRSGAGARPSHAPKPNPPQKPGTRLNIKWTEIW